MHAQPASVATSDLVCCDFAPSEYSSNYACLNNVSTNHSPFVEAATVSERQLMARIA